MKKYFTLIICMWCFFPLFSQNKDDKTKNDCTVKNITINNLTHDNQLSKYLIDENRSGVINLHPFTLEDIGGWENFISSIKTDPNITFRYKGNKPSRLFDGVFHQYQQLYNGIEVEDGGFTIFTNTENIQAIAGPPCPGCPLVHPCDQIQMFTPYIYENINISSNPTISNNQISNALQGNNVSVISKELKIVNNLTKNCEYRLVFLTKYNDRNEGDMIGWVDAIQGKLLYKTNQHNFKNAPTTNFGVRNMNDQINGNNTVLRNDVLAVHNMANVTTFINPFTGAALPVGFTSQCGNSFNDNQIPTSPTTRDWEVGDASTEIFQAFWMADEVITTFSTNLGINFTNVHIGVHPTAEGASSFSPGTPSTRSDFVFGLSEGNSTIEYDVLAHELGHSIIREFISSFQIEGGSLHEGLADIFGTYIESILDPNGLDWQIGDDIPFVFRDLENTTRNCFTDIQNLTQVHERGEALGHWFFLCVNGNPDIQPMNIDEVMNLIVDALPNVGTNTDYPDLMRAVMTLAESRFGTCSDQFITILRAWERICVPTGHRMVNPNAPCAVLTGNTYVCEESNYINICIGGNIGLSTNFGSWTIIGRNSTSFKSTRGMQGNSQYGGHCLQIYQIPDMQFYPQTITIQYWHPEIGETINTSVVINDCDGDDPTCSQYHNVGSKPINLNNQHQFNLENIEEIGELRTKIERGDITVKVFDIMGRILNLNELNQFQLNKNNQLLIYTYWDNNGKLISSKKVFW